MSEEVLIDRIWLGTRRGQNISLTAKFDAGGEAALAGNEPNILASLYRLADCRNARS